MLPTTRSDRTSAAQAGRTGRRAVAALGLGAAAVLAACGGSGGGGADPSALPGPGDDVPVLEGYADLSGQVLEVAATWSGQTPDDLEAVLDVFEASTGARVVILGLGTDPAGTISDSVDRGAPPDVALLTRPEDLEELARGGDLVPLTGDVAAAVEEGYSPAWLELGTVDDELYAVWLTATNKSVLWFDVDVYEEAGAGVPSTWEELQDTLRLVSASGVPGLSVGADIGWPLSDWFENAYLHVAGPQMYDRLVEHEVPWTDETVVETLEALAEVWDEDLLLAGGADRTYGEAVAAVFTDPPLAATVLAGESLATDVGLEADGPAEGTLPFYPWPSMDGSPSSVIGTATAAVALDTSPATLELMRYLASPEAADVWIERGAMSPHRHADLELYPGSIQGEVARLLTEAEVFRFDLSDLAPPAFAGVVPGGMMSILTDFYADPSDPRAAARALEDAAVLAYADD